MKNLKFWAKLLITVLLLWLVSKSVDLGTVMGRIGLARPVFLLLALAAFLIQIFILAYRWSLVLRAIECAIPTRAAIRFTFIAQFFNQGLPSAIGGDAVRALLTYRLTGQLKTSIHSVIADRIIATAMLLAMVLLTYPLQTSVFSDGAVRWGVNLLAGSSLTAFLVCCAIGNLPNDLVARRGVLREIAAIGFSITKALTDLRGAALTVLLSVLNHVLTICGMLWLALALHLQPDWQAFVVLVPVVLLLTLVPLSIGGWGLRESVMVILFARVGVASADAFALSLLFGACNTLASLPGMILWLLQQDTERSLTETTKYAS